MSQGVGDGNAEVGPWPMSTYKHCKTMSDFRYPAPAETFVFVDEHHTAIKASVPDLSPARPPARTSNGVPGLLDG